ncbi:MAG: discoidin domain-containing protein [Deltaproteobacteria bacterium]|nr:discoidin domain-containing protein [Deltaproteobacteria bacterium]
MTRHILEGEFPWLYYGDAYGGILEPLLATWSGLFHGVTPLSLNSISFLFSLLFIISLYQLGRELYNREIGLLSMLLAAIPPSAIYLETSLAIGGYIEGLCLGNWILLWSYRLADPKASPSLSLLQLFGLGLLWGITWWTYPITLVYLITSFCFIGLQKKEFLLKGKASIAIASFFLGSLPFWIWNITYGFPFFRFVQSGGKGNFWTNTLTLFNQVPMMFGYNPLLPVTLGAFFFVFLFLVSLLFLLIPQKKFSNPFPSDREGRLLLIFLMVFVIIFSTSGFGERASAIRYLVPLYTLFPITLALFFRRVRTKSSFLSYFFIFSFLFYYGLEHRNCFTLLQKKAEKTRKQTEVEADLFRFLKEKKIRYAYAPEYWDAARLTFDTGEDLIFSLPFNDRYPFYTLLADASSHPAFVLGGSYLSSFEEMFHSLGGTHKREIFTKFPGIKGYVLCYDFKPPLEGYQEIPPDNWEGRSNFNSKAVNRAFDRNIATQWTSSHFQEPGMYYQIDLGRIYRLNRIELLAGKNNGWDFPGRYRVEVSSDLKTFQEKASVQNQWANLFWSLDRPFWKLREGRTEFCFDPVEARYIKITLEGKKLNSWTIGEIFVYRQVDRPSSEAFLLEAFLSFLSREKLDRVYADVGLSALLTHRTNGKIKCLQSEYEMTNTSDYPINGYQDTFPYFNQMKREVRFSSETAFVVKEEDQPAFVRALEKNKRTARFRRFGGTFVYYHFQPPDEAVLSQPGASREACYWSGTHLLALTPPSRVRNER